MRYRKKPVVIEAITFDEFVQYGKSVMAESMLVKGMPWSFIYKGQTVTHENDECYLIPTPEGTMRFTPDDILITGVNGEIYPCKLDIFEKTYEPVSEAHSLEEFRKCKEGEITPKALIQHLLENIEQVETVGFVIKKKDGLIDSGWSHTTHLEALGLYELGKNRIIFDMGEE